MGHRPKQQPGGKATRPAGDTVPAATKRARFGAVVQDLVAMYCGAWSEEPGLRPAFFRGFGRELSAQEEHALTCLSALDAVSCLGWAPGQGDLQAAARGRRTLDRLMGAYA
ncbi:hypothetical protein OHA74_13455 [Streptomyces phaeochromogenes]|uniref:hypothetical protein n=1 Tax=Streptomyces phaeochromogenes TaxID=1923 RepID=UPI002E2D87AE|nr:hypothetical protein [Streptomyces phaeochromogenes]